ncbi:hypothetical protein GCM10011609_87430 [Lentzea pudingi]|uniref:Transposase n=1 Tax=Lentzea pudingi TaxID=1789439 RepID=A0ABQ2IXV7_9PSEU|nr:hypothetical protein [Lentzea pudingi]GGN29974.1 hypothetical protein GCM10011609_87430 [Lentzea pudingi]
MAHKTTYGVYSVRKIYSDLGSEDRAHRYTVARLTKAAGLQRFPG